MYTKTRLHVHAAGFVLSAACGARSGAVHGVAQLLHVTSARGIKPLTRLGSGFWLASRPEALYFRSSAITRTMRCAACVVSGWPLASSTVTWVCSPLLRTAIWYWLGLFSGLLLNRPLNQPFFFSSVSGLGAT